MSLRLSALVENPCDAAAADTTGAVHCAGVMDQSIRRSGALRVLRTARYIPLPQLAARARYMALRRCYALAPEWPIRSARRAAAGTIAATPLPVQSFDLLAPDGAQAVAERAAAVAQGRFCYLGREADFSAGIRWHDPQASPLWAFNLHYLGSVLDLVLSGHCDDAQRVLASWRAAFEDTWDPVAWHPYPVSLRLTHLCLAAGYAGGFDALGRSTAHLAATHAAFLLRHLEHDLRGNHLLENACALLFAARCLQGALAQRCETVARALLAIELPEQILADGGHFELSPMYHTLMLHRLLQMIGLLGSDDPLVRETLVPAATRMAGFLGTILCPDGDIPLLGDSARGCAPNPHALLALAKRLGLPAWVEPRVGVTALRDSGLHVFRSRRVWAILDAGRVCPAYLPGHGQADSLTLEVWCDGACIVGDPGVHEYTGPERAWNRSSRAHSTLTIDDADTSEVYGSFRVGGRARVTQVVANARSVTATLEPFGARACLTRTVHLRDTPRPGIEICDAAAAPATSTVRARLHLHPAVVLAGGLSAGGREAVVRSPSGLVRIRAQHPMHLERGRASRYYGRVEPTMILVQELGPRGQVAGTFMIEPLDP